METIGYLAGLAATLGFVHTLLGPDHYLPFIFMARARKWSMVKTIWITVASGFGHVLSSVVIGIIGIAAGYGISEIEGVEGSRGDWAGYAFVMFGVGYLIYAFWRLAQNKPQSHQDNHSHVHNKKLTPWILFLIFVLGPCEPLIPFLMYPAAENSTGGVILVTSVFAIVTIATMLTVVLLGIKGFSFVKLGKLEKYTHVIAGTIVLLSGLMILVGL